MSDMIEVPNLETVSTSKFLDVGGPYVLNVTQVPEKMVDPKSGKPYLNVHYKCQQGPTQKSGQSPVGMEFDNRLYLTPEAVWKYKQFLIAAGIITRDDTTSEKARGKLDRRELLGVTVQVNITESINKQDPSRTNKNVEFIY